jgi:hypothetical protein
LQCLLLALWVAGQQIGQGIHAHLKTAHTQQQAALTMKTVMRSTAIGLITTV